MEALRTLKNTLDEAFRVPGTNVRFGWDAIVGVVPWVGDVVTALMACVIVMQAYHMGVPKVVQLRMLLNVAIDLVVGAVPLFGDIADVFWKSNSKNFALLEQHAGTPRPASAGDWLFVGGVIAAIAILALIPLLVVYWLVSRFMGRV
jgi:hypothetical protein